MSDVVWKTLAIILISWTSHRLNRKKRTRKPIPLQVHQNDEDMQAAMREARESFPSFASEIPRLSREGLYYSIKVPVESAAGIEHIWLTAPELKEGMVCGKLGNVPLKGGHQLGDLMTVPVDSISDWMTMEDGEIRGGYTLFVLRNRMNESERQEFDRTVGVRLPTRPRRY